MKDFFVVYDAERDATRQVLMEAALGIPSFRSLIESLDPAVQQEQEAQQRRRESEAVIEGKWGPYLENLHEQGANYARTGLSFTDWYRLLTAWRGAIIGPLSSRYADDPQRLQRAILGMDAFIDIGMATIGSAYLTEREARLERHAEALARSNRELDDFAYVASHDLRAPLRNVDNLVQWIVEDVGDDVPEATRRHVQLLREQVRRMERLLDDLLEFSRVGRTDHSSERINLMDVLQESLALLVVPETFTVRTPDAGLELHSPAAPLKQVLLNLISNAIKHHDRTDGTIGIEFRPSEDHVEVVVSDDGPGIDPSLHERAFEMFRQLHPPGVVEGTGMGLALVKKVVEAHGGSVHLDSEVGRGTRVSIIWPRSID